MAKDGLLIGEAALRTGASRKALRLYESAGILQSPRRTPTGYRIYAVESLAVLTFIRQARRLGFTLAEIKEIVAIRRAGGAVCPHVRERVHRKAQDVAQRLKDLTALQDALRAVLRNWRSPAKCDSAICPKIEGRRRRPRKEQQ